MTDEDYNFEVSETDKAQGVILADGTKVVFVKEKPNSLVISYPTKKFKEIFEKQFDKENIIVEFNHDEIKALLMGFQKINDGSAFVQKKGLIEEKRK